VADAVMCRVRKAVGIGPGIDIGAARN